LEVQLVDKNGFDAHIGPKGVRLLVTPRDALLSEGGGGIVSGGLGSPRGRRNSSSSSNSSSGKKDLSKRATHEPQITMPKFSLDQKVLGGDEQAFGKTSKSAERAERERAARVAKEGVALLVRAE
ncbi:unnamed protein product, partial [Ectocarpus sp. 12 AP-2014]